MQERAHTALEEQAHRTLQEQAPTTRRAEKPRAFTVIQGHAEVLAQQESLSRLAERCGQGGAMAYLSFFFSDRRFGAKIPHLLVRTDAEGELEAAVLLHEYRFRGVRTRIFIPVDFYGERNVLAAEAERSSVAVQAAEFLLKRGALLVLVSLRDGDFSPDNGAAWGSSRRHAWTNATQVRTLLRTLPLAATFDATLAPMGSHTRRNLRNFRRRAQAEFGATFVPQAELGEAEFLELNLRCLYTVPPWVAKWRFQTAHDLPGGMFAGLRAADGRWLSLIGGRRHRESTFVDWQMNVSGMEDSSIGAAMRAWLLEHEVGLGMQRLLFEGGTPHSIRTAFIPEMVADLVLARRFMSPAVLRKLIARMLPKGNQLADILLAETLVWHRWKP